LKYPKNLEYEFPAFFVYCGVIGCLDGTNVTEEILFSLLGVKLTLKAGVAIRFSKTSIYKNYSITIQKTAINIKKILAGRFIMQPLILF
jgi:hypothetical protein